MSHNRTTLYSAPYKRNTLLGLNQYIASDLFPELGRWDRARSEDLYVVQGTPARTQPVNMIIVGAISSDRASLKPHGNYDPSWMEVDEMGKKAKLRFVLTSPEGDPDFMADYDLSVKRLKKIQDEVAGSPTSRNHFIEGSNLRMNFCLFTEKDLDEDAAEGGADTGVQDSDHEEDRVQPERYEVAQCYQFAWDAVSETHHNNIMEVYGANELPVNYRSFDRRLRSGTTVVVTFSLKHFAIREKGNTQVVSDTYCAMVQSVSILKEAEKPPRRSFKSLPSRRPLPVSQTPNRATLKLAADTFAPVSKGAGLGSSSDSQNIPVPTSEDSLSGRSGEKEAASRRTGRKDGGTSSLSSSPSSTKTVVTQRCIKSSQPMCARSDSISPIALGITVAPPSSHSDSTPSKGDNFLTGSLEDLSELSESTDSDMPPLMPISDFEDLDIPLLVEEPSPVTNTAAGEEVEELSSWVKVPLSATASSDPVEHKGRGNSKKMKTSASNTNEAPKARVYNFMVPSEIDTAQVAGTSKPPKKISRTTRRTKNTRT